MGNEVNKKKKEVESFKIQFDLENPKFLKEAYK